MAARQAEERANPNRARALNQPIPVRITLVTEGPIEEKIGATAVTEASEVASIWISRGLGLKDHQVTVTAVHVAEGQRVKASQLLFELDNSLFAQAVKRQETALAVAQSELDNIKRFHKSGVASAVELSTASLKLELSKLDLHVAQRDLEWCSVRSPIDGFAGRVDAVIGEQVRSGKEFTKIYKLDPIHVRIDFPAQRINDAFIGQDAEVVLDSFPQKVFPARVVRVSPIADTRLRVLPVVLEVRNRTYRIKAGITGFARLSRIKTAITVPELAVVSQGGRSMVFLVESGVAKIREIVVGPLVEPGVREVLDGLSSGDEVVIHGTESLQEGDTVDTNWQEWSGRE